MSIRIDAKKCVRCGNCLDVCPGDLISMGIDGSRILRPEDCWGCASCLKECAFGAISFFLGKDIGGDDTYMQVKKDGRCLHWIFYDSSGQVRTITVDQSSSNKY